MFHPFMGVAGGTRLHVYRTPPTSRYPQDKTSFLSLSSSVLLGTFIALFYVLFCLFLIFNLPMYRFVFVSLLGKVPRGLRNEAEMDCVLSARAVGADLKFDRHVGNPTRSHSTNDGRYSI